MINKLNIAIHQIISKLYWYWNSHRYQYRWLSLLITNCVGLMFNKSNDKTVLSDKIF